MRAQASAPQIADPQVNSWKIGPTTAEKNQVIEDILRYIKDRSPVTPSNLFRYRLCLDEAITNSITHGCKGVVFPKVSVHFHWSPASWAVKILDPGAGFDVSRVPDPTEPGQQFQEHGRGILIMDRYCQDVVFSQGGREVTLIMKSETVPA